MADWTYDRDSGKFGDGHRGCGGHHGCDGVLLGGCAGGGVGSRGESASCNRGLSFDNLLGRGLCGFVVLGRGSLLRGILLWGILLRRSLLRGSLLRRVLLRRSLLRRGLLRRSLLRRGLLGRRRGGDIGNLNRGVLRRRRWGSDFRRWRGTASANGDRNSGRGHRGRDIVYCNGLGRLVLPDEEMRIALLQTGKPQ